MDSYVFIKPKQIDEKILGYVIHDQAGELAQLSMISEKAFCEIKENVIMLGGKPILFIGFEACFQLSPEKLNEFVALLKKYQMEFTFSVGMGSSVCEAYKALCFAEKDPSRNLIMYSMDVEQSINEDAYDNLEKALPDSHSYDDVHNLELPGIELNNDKQQESSESSSSESPEQSEQEDPRKKIMETLMEIKQIAPQISQIKQSNPKLYQVIKDVVDSMIALAENRG